MFHARDDWTAAYVHSQRSAPRFGRRAEPLSLIVDLAERPLSLDWWGGVATLLLLSATALSLAPGTGPLPAGRIAAVGDRHQSDALAIAPLASGSGTGLRLVETEAVEPLTSAPERVQVDLFLTLGGNDSVGR